MPSRQPRWPSIGLNSCSSSTRARDRLDASCPMSLGQLAPARLVVRQELVQRRIEQADRDRPALHRPEDAVEVLALERQQLGQRRLAGPRRRRRGSSRASSSIVPSSKNMCSVRHRPMPSAPNATASLGLVGLVGVGADLQLAVLVGPASSACAKRLVDRRLLAASASCRSAPATTSLGLVATWPSNTSPVKPSIEIQSPSLSTLPPTVHACRAS